MPLTCAIPNCFSGYRSHSTDSSVSFHGFPTDRSEQWCRAIPRANFNPSKYSKYVKIIVEL